MHLQTFYVRFYKSFNYDYLRKFRTGTHEWPWETVDGTWYPFVRVKVDPKVTVVVGANESGKTHLLSAIEKGITGNGISRQDFCRYSPFFTVERGKMKLPDFGVEWRDLAPEETEALREMAGLSTDATIDHFHCFRRDADLFDLYIPAGEGFSHITLDRDGSKRLEARKPRRLIGSIAACGPKVDHGLALSLEKWLPKKQSATHKIVWF